MRSIQGPRRAGRLGDKLEPTRAGLPPRDLFGLPRGRMRAFKLFAVIASVLQAASLDFAFASERLLQSPGHFEGNRRVQIAYSAAPPHRCIFSRQFGAHSDTTACASFTLVDYVRIVAHRWSRSPGQRH